MPKRPRQIRIEGDLAYVPLTKGYEAVIDAADAGLVAGVNWIASISRRADGTVRSVYAVRYLRQSDGRRTLVLMHRVIAQTPVGLDTDHVDGDGLNNRRGNLRAASKTQNGQNSQISIRNSSGVKGVSFNRDSKKWDVRIVADGKSHYFGRFADIGQATEVAKAARSQLHQSFGRHN